MTIEPSGRGKALNASCFDVMNATTGEVCSNSW